MRCSSNEHNIISSLQYTRVAITNGYLASHTIESIDKLEADKADSLHQSKNYSGSTVNDDGNSVSYTEDDNFVFSNINSDVHSTPPDSSGEDNTVSTSSNPSQMMIPTTMKILL